MNALVCALAAGLGLAAIFATDDPGDDAQSFRPPVLELRAEVEDLQWSAQLFATTGRESLADTIRARTILLGALALLGGLGFSWWVATLLEERRKLSEALESSRQALEIANREMEQLIYAVSHDLKTPLVTSLGFIGMMREMADEGEPELALSKLEVLERSNRRMSELITGLLELSRIGRLHTEREHVDPRPVIEEVLEQLATWIEAAGCTVHVAPDLPRILVSPTRLGQVIDNLVTNALEYGRPEQGPFEVHIETRPARSGRALLIVRDRGTGIAPEHHDRVFGLFSRLSSKGERTGIGLAIVQRVMQTSGGSVTLSSQGRGDGCAVALEFDRASPGDHCSKAARNAGMSSVGS